MVVEELIPKFELLNIIDDPAISIVVYHSKEN